MINRILIIIFCCITSVIGFSQQTGDEDTVDSTVAVQDSIMVFTDAVPRKISNDSASVLKNDAAFAYMQYIDSVFRNKKPPPEKIRERQKESKSIFTNEGLRTLYWLIAITAVIVLLYKMSIGSNALFAGNKKISGNTIADDELKGIINEDSISIDDAVAAKKYRLATRLLYLQAIKLLGEKQLLLIAPQKTNYQYVAELKNDSLRERFAELTLHYEYTWFGNFQLSSEQFKTIQTGFINFTNSIN
jgi:hypothetical protein